MNASRRKIAPKIPQNRTRYWCSSGTPKKRNRTAKTKRLSIDNDFSTNSAARKSVPALALPRVASPHHQMSALNARARPIQKTLQPADSRSDGAREWRWKTSKSNANSAATNPPKATQCHQWTSSKFTGETAGEKTRG